MVDLPPMPPGAYRVKLMLYECAGADRTVIQLGVKEESVDKEGYVQVASLKIETGDAR